MKRIILLLITILLLSACASSQTEAPPTETSVPATPTPNPYAEDAIIAFCNSANEYDVEKALQLFTEDIEIKIVNDNLNYEGFSGVENLFNDYIQREMNDCKVKKFKVKGDDVQLTWTHFWIVHEPPTPDYLIKTICKCYATMQGDKIQNVTYQCDNIPVDMIKD